MALDDLDASLKDYFAYMLADMATVEPDLEDAPLMASFDLSEELGFADAFDAVANKDLKLTKKRVAAIRKERAKPAETVVVEDPQ